jgi:hypothetical protein
VLSDQQIGVRFREIDRSHTFLPTSYNVRRLLIRLILDLYRIKTHLCSYRPEDGAQALKSIPTRTSFSGSNAGHKPEPESTYKIGKDTVNPILTSLAPKCSCMSTNTGLYID